MDKPPSPSKWCSDCATEKPRANFGRSSRAKDGLAHYCKPCFRERRKASYLAHLNYYRDYYDEYRRRHGQNVLGRRFRSKYNPPLSSLPYATRQPKIH